MTKIVSKNLNDHQNLLFLLDEGLKICETLAKKMEWSNYKQCQYDVDILRYFNYPMAQLSTVEELITKNRYIESLVILRTVFEYYFLFQLISKGIIYPYPIITDEKEKNKKEEQYDEFLGKVKKGIREGKLNDVVKIEHNRPNSMILYVKGLKDKEVPDRIIPKYYFMYQQYNPMRKYVDKLPTFRSLDTIPKITEKLRKAHGGIHHYFIDFERGIKRGLSINGMITKQEWDRIIVHYNFLSLFTHMCYECIKKIEEGYIKHPSIDSFDDIRKFDHYLSELIILYVLRFIEYYLKIILHHDNETWKLSNIEEIDTYLNKVNKEISYFWFIFEEPHNFDMLKREDEIWIFKKSKGYFPKKIIYYYKDPLERLKKMHENIYYIATGKSYESPFK